MKLDRAIFYRFFYAGETECGRAKSNTSFYGNAFKSYNTTIGIKTPGKDGRPVLLIADSPFSRTTGEHISALRAASFSIPTTISLRFRCFWLPSGRKRPFSGLLKICL